MTMNINIPCYMFVRQKIEYLFLPGKLVSLTYKEFLVVYPNSNSREKVSSQKRLRGYNIVSLLS